MTKFKKVLLKIVIILVLLLLVSMYFVSHFHYSDGSRTGYLSKFTKKGYVFKTYEGELFLGGVNAANSTIVNNAWEFSVPSNDNGAIDSLKKYEGKVVRLHYNQVIKSFPWQGDCDYFVYKAEYVREK
ncbi:MAG: 6-phosphogluconate dehydrogenase [Bacteroidia bacterium]